MKKNLRIVISFVTLWVGMLSGALAVAGVFAESGIEMKDNGRFVNVPVEMLIDEAGVVSEEFVLDEGDEVNAEVVTEVAQESVQETVAEAPKEVAREETPAPAVTTPVTPVAPVARVPVASEPEVDGILEIMGKTLAIDNVATTAELAPGETTVKRCIDQCYDGKFLYGHNSAEVFGSLSRIQAGARFSTTIDGRKRNYVVSRTVIFDKNRSTGRLEINGESSFNNRDYMNSIARGWFQGTKYDLAIMTCHGAAIGRADAAQRFVVFAREV